MPMPGFELRISGVGSECSTNSATTTARIFQLFVKFEKLMDSCKIDTIGQSLDY